MTLKRAGGLLAAAALALAACQGSKGANGVNGTDGTSGTNGTNGTNGISGTSTGLKVQVASVTNDPTKPISVRFTLKDDHGLPVDVNGGYSVNTPISIRFALASVSQDSTGVLPYTVLTNSGTPSQPTAFSPSSPNSGTLVENGSGNGDYTYTFPASVAYDATKLSNTHVVWIQASRQTDLDNTNDTKTFWAVNQEYDYVPSGSGTPLKREIVATSSCSKCHDGFKVENFANESTIHGGGRVQAPFCNICHNPGRVTNPAANSAVFIHRIHNSEALQQPQTLTSGTATSGTAGGVACTTTAACTCTVAVPCINVGGNLFHGIEVTYPQDIRNCDACHAGAAQGAQALSRPSRAACGSCHDYVDFSGATSKTSCTDPVTVDATTGIPVPCNHFGGPQANDTSCASCHTPDFIRGSHLTVVPPDAKNVYDVSGGNGYTNAAYLAAAGAVPAGAVKISYVVSGVSAVSDTSVSPAVLRPQIVFKLQKTVNGTTSDVVFNTSNGTNELIDGFVGSPSVYFAYALPQDGIAAPADFNASASGYIRNIWNGTATGAAAGQMTGPDATTGFYTITLTGVVLPSNYRMLTGGVGYTYGLNVDPTKDTQPLTEIDLPAYPTRAGKNVTTKLVGGLIVPAPDVWKPASSGDQRRAVVDSAKCNNCHVALGVAPTFHVGQRNDAPTCNFCHNVNKTNNGWGLNEKDFVHALHGGRMRNTPFTWQATATDSYADVTFPGPLNYCEACHVPNTYDFSATASAAAVPNLLWTTEVNGTPATGITMSPYVTAGFNYGAGYSVSAATGAITPADATTLVTSPIMAACVACHDGAAEKAHMEGNGGSFYQPRGAVNGLPTTTEQCLLCHGQGGIADIQEVHK